MVGNFGRRILDLAVLFLAAYAFAFVPLGSRTALEHCRAILRTRAARDAGRDIVAATDRLRQRIFSPDEEPMPGRGTAVVPRLPHRSRPPADAVFVPVIAEGPPDASL